MVRTAVRPPPGRVVKTQSRKNSQDRGSINASFICALLHALVSAACRMPWTRTNASFLSSGVKNLAVWGSSGTNIHTTMPQRNVAAPMMMKRNYAVLALPQVFITGELHRELISYLPTLDRTANVGDGVCEQASEDVGHACTTVPETMSQSVLRWLVPH